MPTKIKYKGQQAYKQGQFAIYQVPEKLWITEHIDMGLKCMGPNIVFDKKRKAVSYVDKLINSDINWDCKTSVEFWQKNKEEKVEAVWRSATNEASL